MRRFFAEKLDIESGVVRLTGDEARHIGCVLRMKAGDEVLLINGEGGQSKARITELTGEFVELEIIEKSVCLADPDVHVTLFQCLPKQGKMEVIIQKCVELGVWSIVPTVSKRCIVKLDGKDNKLIRWNKVSAEAAKQCGRAYVPEVASPVTLSKAPLEAFDLVLIAYENEDRNALKAVLRAHSEAERIAVIIGPEGGFEPAEVEACVGMGAIPVSLGKRILRTETAGMAALAQIMYELDQ